MYIVLALIRGVRSSWSGGANRDSAAQVSLSGRDAQSLTCTREPRHSGSPSRERVQWIARDESESADSAGPV